MLIHRAVTAFQNVTYVAISLAVYRPVQHLSLAGRQLKRCHQRFDDRSMAFFPEHDQQFSVVPLIFEGLKFYEQPPGILDHYRRGFPALRAGLLGLVT